MLRTREVRYSNDCEKWSTIEILPLDSTIDPKMLSPSVLLRRLKESVKRLGRYCVKPLERILNRCLSEVRFPMFIRGFAMIYLTGLC